MTATIKLMKSINKNLHKLVIMLIVEIIVFRLTGPKNCYHNLNSESGLSVKYNCFICYSINSGLQIVENSIGKVLKKMHNKIMHMTNGNKKTKKTKTHYKIYQVNKGNSDFGTFVVNLSEEVKESKADLAIISEANYDEKDDSVYKELFKDYYFEESYVEGCRKARLIVLIKKGIQYSRIDEYDHKYTSSIWIRLKTSKRKYLYVLCLYRQWHLVSEANVPDSGLIANQLERLAKALEPIDDLRAKGHQLLVGGDINIDHLVANNPRKRWDIARLTDLLDDVRDRNDLEIVNDLHKPTRFQRGQTPSLLDLFIASHPE